MGMNWKKFNFPNSFFDEKHRLATPGLKGLNNNNRGCQPTAAGQARILNPVWG